MWQPTMEYWRPQMTLACHCGWHTCMYTHMHIWYAYYTHIIYTQWAVHFILSPYMLYSTGMYINHIIELSICELPLVTSSSVNIVVSHTDSANTCSFAWLIMCLHDWAKRTSGMQPCGCHVMLHFTVSVYGTWPWPVSYNWWNWNELLCTSPCVPIDCSSVFYRPV